MRAVNRSVLIVAAVLALLFAGCVKVGPDFHGPGKVKLPDGWNAKAHRSDSSLAKWWRIYRDPALDRLVDMMYKQNLDLKSAALRIVQARALLGISHGMSFPQKQSISGSYVSADSSRTDRISKSDVSFDMGWELDLWGKYARGVESAEADLYAAIASYDDILVSLIAELARSYIQYCTAQERIAFARRNIEIQKYVTKVTEIQFNSGNVSELDMQQARTQLHSTKAALYELKLSKIRARNAIAMLLGINPKEADVYLRSKRYRDNLGKYMDKDKGTLQLEEKKAVSLGTSIIPRPFFDPNRHIDAQLITRRPDVRMAEHIAHSRSAQIGIAKAELYPSFSLLGTIGYGNDSNTPHIISVIAGPSFAWNIFQYGRIKNSIRLQDAIFEESLLNYNKSVLEAVHEVSYALDSYRLTLRQLRENEAAVKASIRAFNISMKQYSDGLVSYQRLLNSVEKLTRFQDQYARIKGDLAIEVASLYKALGGGWQLSRGRRYLSSDSVRRMKERTDWGDMLKEDNVVLPKGWSR